MAEISKIKTTDNSVYDIKVFTDHVYPFLSKTYTSTSYYATAANQAKSTFYCMKIRPDAYNIPWMVKFKVHTFCPDYPNYNSITYSTFMGRQNGLTYANFNEMDTTGHYYITFYPLLTAGYNAGYSHAVGISLFYAGNYTSANYYRTFEISVYSTENCTVDLLDTPVLWENWTGGTTTNYGTLTNTNGFTKGLQQTGDNNDTAHFIRYSYSNFISATVMYRYQLMLQQDETTLIPLTTYNNAPSTTTKELTTKEFDPFGIIAFYNSTTTVNANTAIATSAIMLQYAFDLRYCSNVGQTLTAQKDIYLVAVPQSNGKAKLHTTPFVQDLPTTDDGLLYIYLGRAYNAYQIILAYRHPIYMYRNGAIRLYTGYQSLIEGADNSKEDKTPYTFRAIRESTDKIIGNRAYDEIVGVSVGWNQQIKNAHFDAVGSWKTISTGTLTVLNNVGKLTANGTYYYTALFQDISVVPGHKYIVQVDVKDYSNDVAYVSLKIDNSDTAVRLPIEKKEFAIIGEASNNPTNVFYTGVRSADTSTLLTNSSFVEYNYVRRTDLTLALGSTIADYVYTLETATAGSGVAWLKTHFPKMFGQYQPYDAGSIQSVTGLSAHKMTGFNQYDKTAVTAGKWISDSAKGTIANNAAYSVTDYIPVIPGLTYYVGATGSARNTFFDQNKVGIGQFSHNAAGTAVIPANAYYIRCTLLNENVDGFCINIHGERDGEYEAYKKWTYPLDSTKTFRGVLKLDASNKPYADGDEYLPDGTVTRRYGIVDLGTLEWSYSNTSNRFTSSIISDARAISSRTEVICGKYVYASSGSADKTCFIYNGGVYVYDSSYTDVATFKTAISGVYLVYERAEAVTETAEPYTSPQYVDEYGTEEYVSTSIVPVGHNTIYFSNNQEKLNNLPTHATEDGQYIIQQKNNIMSLVKNTGKIAWGTCNTDNYEKNKIIVSPGFKLLTGQILIVKTSTSNLCTNETITLNVNNTGAKNVYTNGEITSYTNNILWQAGETISFFYDGEKFWRLAQPDNSIKAVTNWQTNTTPESPSGVSVQTFNDAPRNSIINIGNLNWYDNTNNSLPYQPATGDTQSEFSGMLITLNNSRKYQQYFKLGSQNKFYIRNEAEGNWTSWDQVTVQKTTTTWSTPTVYSSRCTVQAGGYFQQGKHTYIQMHLKLTSSYNNQSAGMLLSGFPIPKGNMQIPITVVNSESTNCIMIAWISVSSNVAYLNYKALSSVNPTTAGVLYFSGHYVTN